ncbi:MAG: PPC domain-containing protein [Candidatus Promineifilaceae bacterium]
MRRFAWFCLVACLLVTAAACSGPGGDLRGATPAGYIRPAANPVAGETAELISIADLIETPEAYEDQVIEISGLYYQRQVVVCSTRPQYSPARWALSDGEQRVPIGALDDNLENLPSGQIEIAVIGRWLRWQGPVGCGRQAKVTEVWYLDVLEIVSPNPITIAAAGSGTGSTSIEIQPSIQPPILDGGYPGPETESEEPQGGTITATLTISGTQPAGGVPGSAGTPILPPTPTTANEGTVGTATPTLPGVTPTPTTTTNNNATSTATSTTSTPSPTTTTNGSPAPTATATSGSGPTIVEQDELPSGSLETALLGPNEVHSWPFVITDTAIITVSIASEFDLDAVIMIQDPSGNIVAQQNDAQDGAPEILTEVPLGDPGTYNILITGENDSTGYYAILVTDGLDEDYYTFVFNGTIAIGDSRSVNERPNNDHFWHFYGEAGTIITIRVTPSDNADLFIRLFGPNDTLPVDFHNESSAGEAEEILSFSLPDTGFYSILVGELSFGAATYTISLTSG